MLSDGSRARLGAIDEAERARRAQAATLEGAIHRGLPEILRDHARRDRRRLPRVTGASPAATGSTAWPAGPLFDLARFVTGSEGTLVAITEATVGLVELPKARLFALGHFDSVDAAIAATHDALELGAAAIEMIDSHDPRALALASTSSGGSSETIEGDPAALLYVTFFGDTQAEAAARLDRLESRLAQQRPRLPHVASRVGGRAGGADRRCASPASAC